MKVTLMDCTSPEIVITAIRKCWNSEGKGDSDLFYDDKYGPKDLALIRRIIEVGHTSTLEHCVFNFEIQGVSRTLLQELARHRIASLSVQSTRYCLKRLVGDGIDLKACLQNSGDPDVDALALQGLRNLVELMHKRPDLKNDKLKYALPEAFLTELVWTVNARSLRNFLHLRSSKAAHFEIRELAGKVYEQIPGYYRFMFEDCLEAEEA